MEAPINLAMTLMKFDFTPMYPGIPFQIRAMTAKPVDKIPMKVALANDRST
jgi:hypothetical protein